MGDQNIRLSFVIHIFFCCANNKTNMAGMLPPNVSYMMQRIQGFSVSHFKLQPQTTGDMSANSIIRFTLPTNSYVNFGKGGIRLFFNATTAGTGGRLPNGLDKLIERIAVYAGGTLIANNFSGYNVYRAAKEALGSEKLCAATGHPEIVRAKSYHDGSAITGTNNEVYSGEGNMFCIDMFEGFLNSVAPSIIDLGLFPQLDIELVLAQNAVCPCVAGIALDGTGAADITDFTAGTSSTYTLSNVSLQVEVIGMASSVLDEIAEQRIASVGYLSLPFTNVFSSVGTHNGSTRFSVNSASLDRIWICYRDGAFASQGGAHVLPGYKSTGGLVQCATGKAAAASSSSTTLTVDTSTGSLIRAGDVVRGSGISTVVTVNTATLNANNGVTTCILSSAQSVNDNVDLTFFRDSGVPSYDNGGVFDTNKEKYISKYFQFQEKLAGATPATYSLQINGASVPAYKLNRVEFLSISKAAVDDYGTSVNHDTLTLNQYTDSFFVQCMRFNMPDSKFSRNASGLDTRSTAAQCSLDTEGLSPCHVTIYCECTSELRVGSGRAISVIQ